MSGIITLNIFTIRSSFSITVSRYLDHIYFFKRRLCMGYQLANGKFLLRRNLVFIIGGVANHKVGVTNNFFSHLPIYTYFIMNVFFIRKHSCQLVEVNLVKVSLFHVLLFSIKTEIYMTFLFKSKVAMEVKHHSSLPLIMGVTEKCSNF